MYKTVVIFLTRRLLLSPLGALGEGLTLPDPGIFFGEDAPETDGSYLIEPLDYDPYETRYAYVTLPQSEYQMQVNLAESGDEYHFVLLSHVGDPSLRVIITVSADDDGWYL